MSLLKTNEIQNYNGSSLTLTASTVSTSAQLNTGGNISVTGSLNVSDDSTTRTNLGLGTIATQDSNNVNLTGGTIGSNVVFPAEHVIQVVQGTWIGVTSTFTSSAGWVDPSWYADIQVQSGNKVLIMIDGSYELITSGTGALVSIASAANNTTVDENDFIINPLIVLNDPVADGVSFSGSYLHTSPQSAVPQRYKILFKSEANYNVRFGSQSGSNYTQNAITLFEIQA